MVLIESECIADSIAANRARRNRFSDSASGAGRKHQFSGFISPSIVGTSSETVGWMWTVREIAV